MPKLYILGAGTPTPTPTRCGSAYVLEIEGEKIMFDCGPATTHKLVKAGLWPTDIDYIFFTHHHSDHDADYACFLLTRFDQSIGKEKELNVYGPPPTKELTDKLIGENDGAYWHDFVARTNHPLSLWAYQERGGKLPRRIPIVNSYNIKPGIVSSGKDWEITSARVEHVQPYLDSLAYRVDYSEGSIVFSGDTKPCKALVDLSVNADVLVMECIRLESEMKGNATSLSETGALEAGKMAEEANVKLLVFTPQAHYLDSVKDDVLKEVKMNYKGKLIWADELMTVNF